jgi:predicted permease
MRWWQRRAREEDLERELRSDLELEAEEQLERGLSPEEARYAAQRAFGNITYVKEEVRQMWGWSGWEIVIQDLRYAWRNLRKSPGFAATAILTLALGIGASTAVFTVVDSVLLKPLSYHESGRLVAVWERIRFLSADPTGPNPRHVDVWQQRTTAFSGLAVARHSAWGLVVGASHPQLVGAVVCPPNLFAVLQVQPLLGRAVAQEAEVRGHYLAILTYSLWQTLFHGDPGVIGKTIRLNDTPREVIGVLPAGFHFPNANALRAFRSGQPKSGVPEPVVFLPTSLDFSQMEWNGNYGNWICLGRLNQGFTISQAEAQLNTIQAEVQREMPANQGDHRPGSLLTSVQPMQEAIVGSSRTGLWLLMSAVIGLMLIACLNLANAQLGRAMARQREAAVRKALGAARWRLILNILTENLLLAVTGGMAGILLAFFGLDLFRRYSPIDLPRLSDVHLNFTVLLFSFVLTSAATVLGGLLPAMRLLKAVPQAALQQNNGRALGSRRGHYLRTWLIGLQVLGCTALLLVTGLFAKSLLHLFRQDKGFETGQVAIAEVGLSSATNRSDQTRIAFDDAVLANLRTMPGIQTAALASAMPLEGESWIEPAQRPDRPHVETPLINLRWVSPGYFEATRQRLIAGRFLDDHDLHATVLTESESRALWGNSDPIGGQVRIEGRIFTVVGVVADSRITSLKSAPVRMAYVHYKDRPPYSTVFLVRSTGAADAVVSGMRQAIWKQDPDATVARIKTLDAQLADSLATERFETLVLLSFGGAALLLAMLGIYGVLSYSVATRRQEIGVRMALGATKSRIYWLTLSEVGTPVVAGLATGLLANLLAGRLIQSLLYGVRTVDPAVILLVVVLFLLAAAAAACLPAHRAASIEPMDALRSE